MDLNEDNDDSDRTESYTPPPLDITNDINNSSEKENNYKDSNLIKQQSIIILDNSLDEIRTNNQSINNYWDQWPLVNDELNDEERLKLYSIPDINIPPSPPQHIISSSISQNSTTINNNILDILTHPTSVTKSSPIHNSHIEKPIRKRKKKKKSMSEYRPPSPFSPKPDYKTMDIEQLKQHAMRYGLSTTQAKGRLIKILDEIYNVTHQYETDTDYEFDLTNDNSDKKDLSHTPPTPAINHQIKKSKKRQAIHEISFSDDIKQYSSPIKKPTTIKTIDYENNDQSDDNDDDDDTDHEGRFLELTVYNLSSSTTSSSSLSISDTPPTLSLNDIHISDSKKISNENSSQTNSTKKSQSKTKPSTPTLSSESDIKSTKKPIKKAKLQTPTIPLKEIVRNYIESNSILHSRILCYEPIDFEEFHKQIKTDLNLKIVSKELMQCLDDQCITFTLRSRKGAFTSVMRAKRRK